jgi:hypothetical protein
MREAAKDSVKPEDGRGIHIAMIRNEGVASDHA